MANEKVFIGVGHGGNDPGAVANGQKESVINLNVALKVSEVLKYHNLNVLLSRYKEENDPLEEEIRECNAFNPILAVDIHVNAGGGDGFEAFYSIDQAYTKGVDKALAQNIEAEVKAIGQNSRGLKTKANSQGRDYFGFIRSLNCPSIIVEMAFIDNINDIKDFDELSEQHRYAIALAKGILKTLGIAYKGDGSAPTQSVGATPYRVRKSWADVQSQKGAYSVLENAIKECQKHVGYAVFDNTGKVVYTYKVSIPTPTPTPTPVAPSCDKELKRYSERGVCQITTPSGINFRNKPCTCHGVKQGVYNYKESVNYDLVVLTERYVWISWISASTGARRYMPIKDKKTNERWANCY